MKRSLILVVVGIVFCGCVSGFAEDSRPGGSRGQRGGQRGFGLRQAGPDWSQLELTEEQKEKIEKIRAAAIEKAKAAEGAEEKLRIRQEMREQIQKVLTDQQQEKIKTDRPRLGARPAKGAEERPGKRPAGMMRPHELPGFDLKAMTKELKLTEEQQAKIARMYRAAMEKFHKDMQTVLTDEQKVKARELRKARQSGMRKEVMEKMHQRMDSALKLTDEQKEKVGKIRTEASEKIRSALTEEEKRAQMERMHQQIKDVLTDEQKDKYEQMQVRMKGPGRMGDDKAPGHRDGRPEGFRGRGQGGFRPDRDQQ